MLVVDDDEDLRFLFEFNLEQAGFEVTQARNGREALRIARELSKPSLIVLDVLMPEQDGWSCLAELKADPDLRDVPVVLVTVRAEAEHVRRGMELGAAAYIPKPVRPAQIVDTVTKVISERGDTVSPLVLVVDDDPAFRRLCREILEGRGYRVAEASDGSEAMRVAWQARPDVLVVDAVMPVMSGWDLVNELNSDHNLHGIPVVMLTGATDPKSEIRGRLLGVAAYMTKPTEFEELAQKLPDLVAESLKRPRS